MSADCICPYTDPSTWLSAASCGHGGGYEPGSMQEWDPDCPVHPGGTHAHACDIPDCGNRRCETCDERMACTGPEPRACLATCVDCECRCDTCVHVRADMRADLIHRINKEASDGAHNL